MRNILIVIILFFTISAKSQSVIQAEYYWDTDPGSGNGIPMVAFDGNFNQALESVFSNNATLPNEGNHVLGIRLKASDGNWGTVFKRVFRVSANNNTNNLVKIIQAEYYWDTDPGSGNGIPMVAFDGNFNQALESVLSNNATLPSEGNHILGIRLKASDGNWGTVFKRVFRVLANNNTNNLVKIIQAEYYWDTDPGSGNGIPMVAFDGNFNQALESVLSNNAMLPNEGNHVLGIRLKASDGNWGTVFKRVFRVSVNNNTNNLVKIIQAEYYWDTDPGSGNGIPMVAFDGNFNQALESVLSNNAMLPNEGNHVLGIRLKASDGNWGSVFRRVFRLSVNNNSNYEAKINQGEYFWNTDPGEGNGIPMLAFDGNFNQGIETLFSSNATMPSSGLNVLNVRTKAADGNWGRVYSKVVGINVAYNFQINLISPANNSVDVPLNSSFLWQQVTGVDSYEYQCSDSSSFTNIIQTGTVNGNTTPFMGLLSNTTYYWRVRANVSGNVSLWSAVWNFKTENTLGTPDNSLKNSIVLSPNPADVYIQINLSDYFEDYNYEIYAIDGRRVRIGKSRNYDKINVEGLAESMYTIKIRTEDGQTGFIKFMKVK